MNDTTVWAALAAPLTKDEVSWRIDGKSREKNGRWTARVVAYCDVPAVVRRLDDVVPGRWTFTASEPYGTADKDGVVLKAVRGTLTVDGVTREDYGQGPDEKQALTDALKRTARLFGIALELWDMGPIWTEVSDGGKYPKITGDPWRSYQNGTGGPANAGRGAGSDNRGTMEFPQSPTAQPAAQAVAPFGPGDFLMPIGKNKGKPIGGLPSDTLQSVADWVHEKSLDKKHADLLTAIGNVLAQREAA